MKKDVCDWLREHLRDGPKEVSEIRAAAKSSGYTRGDLREAKMICGVQVTNNWSPDRPVTNMWFWELPEDKA